MQYLDKLTLKLPGKGPESKAAPALLVCYCFSALDS